VTVPVFPATQEAEITRIILQEKPLIKARCGGKHLLSRSVGGINRRIIIEACLGITNQSRMGGSMAQVVKHLTSKYSALISNHSTAKYI
jgi:hypothetical protein